MSSSSQLWLSKNCLAPLGVGLLLAGCASSQFVNLDRDVAAVARVPSERPVSSSSGGAPAQGNASLPPVVSGQHLVAAGENLYAISLKYSLDYRLLAQANGISAPFTIYPGQRLTLAVTNETHATVSVAPGRPDGVKGPSSVTQVQTSPPGRQNTAAPVAVNSPNTPPQSVTIGNWRWPHLGTHQRPPASAVANRTGIDILGQRGDAVLAAQDAKVVFAGSGLRGYGNLIILQHSANWLSAYAHLSRIDVAEGEEVKAGTKIAEMGERESRALLHFDLRQEGKAVDPLQHLPRR